MFKYLPLSLLGKKICNLQKGKPLFCDSWASAAHGSSALAAERDEGCQPHLYLGSCNSDDWGTYFPRPALVPWFLTLQHPLTFSYPSFSLFSLLSLQFSFTLHPLSKHCGSYVHC